MFLFSNKNLIFFANSLGFFTGTIINSSTAVIGQPNIESGTFNIPIQARNTDFTCAITSDSHLPCHFVSAEIEGFYFRRSRRM